MPQQLNAHFPEVLLAIEAATAAGSVALIRVNGSVIERAVVMGPARDDSLMPAIADVLCEAGMTMKNVCAIACGSGPGSFTSLRIAAALAKGLARSIDVSLHAIPSLLLAALELRDQPGRYLLHSDALRGERFAQTFEVRHGGSMPSSEIHGGASPLSSSNTFRLHALSDLQRLTIAEVADMASLESFELVAVGNGKANNGDRDAIVPRAGNAQFLVDTWSNFAPVDLAQWEPNYGRLAEAQVKWEATHQRTLPAG